MTARPTELAYEDTIVEAAMLAGWRVHAERPARTNKGHRTAIKGHAGYPDLTIVGYGRLIVVELKRKPNKPSADQLAWLDAFRSAGVDARLTYVPEELDELLVELTSRGVAGAPVCALCTGRHNEAQHVADIDPRLRQ